MKRTKINGSRPKRKRSIRKSKRRYSHLELDKEVYQLPYKEGKYILYAPLKRLLFVVNADVINLLLDIQEDKTVPKTEEVRKVISAFIEKGILSKKIRGKKAIGNRQKKQDEFLPTGVTLFLTSDCNLRCVYCYSYGGATKHYLPFNAAKAAIDFIIKNAVKLNKKEIFVGFHGGGEPTLAWDNLRETVLYAQKTANENHKAVKFSLATNGVLNLNQLQWIAEHINRVQISLDGFAEIHDRQRPFPNGSGSFALIDKSIRYFEQENVNYGFRATVTDESVHELKNIITYFAEHYKTKSIHFEPLFECGRCATTKWNAPSNEDFLREFREASKIAKDYGIKLFYSGANIERISNVFCGAAKGGFTMTPEGYITACFEISNRNDPNADLFIYGKYDSEKNKIVIDDAKRQRLSLLSVDNVPFCRDCFAKWHCAGDCPAKVIRLGDYFNRDKPYRCDINLQLTYEKLVSLIEEGEVKDSHLYSFKISEQ